MSHDDDAVVRAAGLQLLDAAGAVGSCPWHPHEMIRTRDAAALPLARRRVAWLVRNRPAHPFVASRGESEAVAALDAVVARIGTFGSTPTWGSVHRLAPIHGFDLVGASPQHPDLFATLRPTPLPLAGDAECVFANAAAVGTHLCITGAAARYVWDLADRGASRWIVPLGVSGDPRSDHFQDQAPRWAAGELIEVVRDWDVLRGTTAAASTPSTATSTEREPCPR